MTTPLQPALYGALISLELERALAALDDPRLVESAELEAAEAPDRLGLHLMQVIERALRAIPEAERTRRGTALARALVQQIGELVGRADFAGDEPVEPARILHAILERNPDGSPRTVPRPSIPLVDTTLLTNAPGEPRVGHQIATEIASAQRIDLVMAFIRLSGLRPLREALRRHCDGGRPLRVLTTVYTGSTERRALDLLAELGARVRVSYDTTSTRLHAKAWLFHRPLRASTAYVGSSNLTHSAQIAGLEWNVRVSGVRNPDVLEKVRAVFESYWESGDFRDYDPREFAELSGERDGVRIRYELSPLEVRPLPFQERLLEELEVSRGLGRRANLLVSATGTGKTVMAALDYARLRTRLPRARLLFVAHRQELLEQSLRTFREVLREPSFGELWVGGRRPQAFEHVFASIQSLQRTPLEHLSPEHFDVVIVDEFHHAAARSYERLLEHLAPTELLGLTATPERADGLSVLEWFGGRIAAELRLWDAIDQHRLVPFAYYGVHDGLDLRRVPWRRGRGYDVEGLTRIYTANDAWAAGVLRELERRVDDLATLRALGFCVSIDHARYMARIFDSAGLTARAVWGDTPEREREDALRALRAGELRVLFSVDLFNEGLDVPEVDTLLLLRPTDSPTLFVQQLGRGLRRAPGKTVCTVLDFVGHQHEEFRFDRRFGALLGAGRKDLERQVRAGFPLLPAGCHMELDRVASDIVLANLQAAVPSQWGRKVTELRSMAATGEVPDLRTYLEHTGLSAADVYAGGRCWSDLREAAGLPAFPAGPHEVELRRALGRLLHADDSTRLEAWQNLAAHSSPPDPASLGAQERSLARMLVAQLAGRRLERDATLRDGLELLWAHPQVLFELAQLCAARAAAPEHLHRPVPGRSDLPLRIHARYTRQELLAAFETTDRARVGSWQTGVRYLPRARADLLAFTLDKTSGSFSPTTRYRDYAISRELIHWESQSVTRADSTTGRRYQRHAATGSEILLFARLRRAERAFWFLGPGTYVSHEGERPMAITWRLSVPLPGDLFAAFAAAVA